MGRPGEGRETLVAEGMNRKQRGKREGERGLVQ